MLREKKAYRSIALVWTFFNRCLSLEKAKEFKTFFVHYIAKTTGCKNGVDEQVILFFDAFRDELQGILKDQLIPHVDLEKIHYIYYLDRPIVSEILKEMYNSHLDQSQLEAAYTSKSMGTNTDKKTDELIPAPSARTVGYGYDLSPKYGQMPPSLFEDFMHELSLFNQSIEDDDVDEEAVSTAIAAARQRMAAAAAKLKNRASLESSMR